eukprot:4658456-Prymnesium_polylepis.1
MQPADCVRTLRWTTPTELAQSLTKVDLVYKGYGPYGAKHWGSLPVPTPGLRICSDCLSAP